MSPLISYKSFWLLYLLFRRAVEGNSNGEIPNISSIRVWSVPSITVTMSLDGVEVTIDDELVTIEETTGDIDIYVREGIYQSRQAEVTYELVKYFKQTIRFDEKVTPLINLLMGASIESLPGILDKHNISRPEGSHDDIYEDSSEQTSDPEDDNSLAEEGTIQSDGHDGVRGSRGENVSGREDSPSDGTVFTPVESGTGTDAEPSSRSYPPCAARRNHPIPLRDLIPSHQLRSEGIIQRASNFRLSNAEAAAPIQHHSESRAAAPRFSLPIRTRPTGSNDDENEHSSSPGRSTTGGSYSRSLGVGYGARGGYPSSASRLVSSGATQGGMADATSEIRARGIGYLGELFVNNPSLDIIHQMANPCIYQRYSRRSPGGLMTGHSKAGQAACGQRRGIRGSRATRETSQTLHTSIHQGK